MPQGIDIRFVRENYQRMTDEEFVRIATQDAAGLTPDAQEVVREEVERRKLDKSIIKGVLAQNRSYTIEEIDEYCDLLRNLTCPSCGTTSVKLNGTMTSEVVSYLVITQMTKELKIACPRCLDKANNYATTKTLLLGWWGIPWGIVRTIQAVIHNTRRRKTNRHESPNDYLRGYVLSKIGQLETFKDDKEKLQQIIAVAR